MCGSGGPVEVGAALEENPPRAIGTGGQMPFLRWLWFAISFMLAVFAAVLVTVPIFRWLERVGITDWLYEHEPLQLVIGIPALLGIFVLIYIFFDLLTLGRWDEDRPRIHFPWWR